MITTLEVELDETEVAGFLQRNGLEVEKTVETRQCRACGRDFRVVGQRKQVFCESSCREVFYANARRLTAEIMCQLSHERAVPNASR